MTEARALAVLRDLRRNAMSRLHRLHTFSPFAASDGVGRAAVLPRRTPVRRGGGLAYPMSPSRSRWYQRQRYHTPPV
jgi:hypothetical protein